MSSMSCEGCGQSFINLFDDKPVCMDCVRARAKAAGTGRCTCGRKAREGEPVGPGVGQRTGRISIPCKRCLGTIRQVR